VDELTLGGHDWFVFSRECGWVELVVCLVRLCGSERRDDETEEGEDEDEVVVMLVVDPLGMPSPRAPAHSRLIPLNIWIRIWGRSDVFGGSSAAYRCRSLVGRLRHSRAIPPEPMSVGGSVLDGRVGQAV
jgi:hypothetical protein